MEQNKTGIKKLYRSRKNRILFGVCGGVAEHFGLDPLIIRIIFLITAFWSGLGVFIYLALIFLSPVEPEFAGKNQEKPHEQDEKNKSMNMKEKMNGLASEIKDVFGKCECGKNNTGFLRFIARLAILFLIVFFLFKIFGFFSFAGFGHNVFVSPWLVLTLLFFLSFAIFRGTFFYILPVLFFLAIVLFAVFHFWMFGGMSGTLFNPMSMPHLRNLELPKKVEFNFDKEIGSIESEISLKTGASSVSVSAGSDDLVSGFFESKTDSLKTISFLDGEIDRISMETERRLSWWVGAPANNFNINLSKDTPVSFKIDSGASKLNLDLSEVLLKNLLIDSGASKIDLILGDKMDSTKVKMKIGASSASISLPKTVGVKIVFNGGLSGKNFVDFKQVGEGIYESNDYVSAEKKIDIDIDSGVSSLLVDWR